MRRTLLALLLAAAAAAVPAASVEAKVFRGKLEVRHSDDFRHGRGQTTWALRTGHGRRVPILPLNPTKLPSGTRIAVRGIKRGRFVQGTVRRRGSTPLHAATALGSHKVAVVLINFSDDTRQPWTPDQVRQRIFTDSDSTAALYDEETYGDITVTGDVFGWYTLAASGSTCDINTWTQQARAAAAADADLSSYDHVMFVFPSESSCGWAGLGEVPGTQTWINGDLSVRVVAHELGHNMGLHHASSYACTTGGTPVTLGASCSQSEYGDPFDVMGLYAHHSNAWHLEQLGVLHDGTDVKTVTSSGTYTLRSALARGTQPALLRVPAGGSPARWFDLSIRQSGGVFDGFSASDPVVNGLSLHYDLAPSAIQQSLLLDATPSSPNGFWDSPLAQGSTFSYGDVSITASSVSSGAATVDVVVGSPPPPPPADTTNPSAPTGLAASQRPGAVDLTWHAASDNVGVAGYSVYRNDALVGGTPYVGWSDETVAPGSTYKYRVDAYDAAGNVTRSAPLFVVVPTAGHVPTELPPADTTAPKVRVVSPRRGAHLRRRARIYARSTDKVGVVRTEASIDGNAFALVDGGRLKRTWRLHGARPGRHRITVRSWDAAGNVGARTVRVRVLKRRS